MDMPLLGSIQVSRTSVQGEMEKKRKKAAERERQNWWLGILGSPWLSPCKLMVLSMGL